MRELLEGRLTILGNNDGVCIEIKDFTSNVRVAKIRLTAEEFCQAALGRLASIECEMLIGDLNKVGKKMINKSFEVELPENCGIRDEDMAKEITILNCPDGWEPDLYFNSQGSFFEKDGVKYARSTIRIWIDD